MTLMTATSVLTVAEFSRLPQPAGGIRQELHHGELFELPLVMRLHTRLQYRLVDLLQVAQRDGGSRVGMEFPFRPAAEYEVWVADVALFDLAAWNQTADDDYFRGVPTIVIEVLSPSNTASEMLDREEVCLRNGGREFWLVDPKRQSVKVVRAGGSSLTYGIEDNIDSAAAQIAVRDIFSD